MPIDTMIETAVKFLKEIGYSRFLITGWFHSIYAVAIAASCLEYKDQAYGNNWDWSDWWCTIIGGLFGQLSVYSLMNFGKLFL